MFIAALVIIAKKTEAMQISFNRRVSKQTAAHPDNKMLLSNKKKKEKIFKETMNTCNNVDEFQRHYAA